MGCLGLRAHGLVSKSGPFQGSSKEVTGFRGNMGFHRGLDGFLGLGCSPDFIVSGIQQAAMQEMHFGFNVSEPSTPSLTGPGDLISSKAPYSGSIRVQKTGG